MARGDLRTGLIEYWPLQEASGNRTGIHAGLILTDNNTVTQQTGPGGSLANAAEFTRANDEYLSLASIAIDSLEWSMSAWLYVDGYSASATETAIYLNEVFPGTKEAFLAGTKVSSSLYPEFQVFSGMTGSFAPLGTGWHSVVTAVNDAGGGLVAITLFLDGQQDDVSVISGEGFASCEFRVGADFGTYQKWDGRVAGVGLWSRALNRQEAADIYDSGNVLPYPWYNGPHTFRRTSGLR